jgi:DNA repair exonuclease SbcCD ATPase subunit
MSFPDAPGLFFMAGENNKEPRLEANGAGKSTVWDAISWLIYGKTPKGLKAGDISSWGVTPIGTSVALQYSHDGQEYELKRTWNPNSFTLTSAGGEPEDLVPDETNTFMHHLCSSGKALDMTAFLSSVYFAQGQPVFLDLLPAAKASLFAEILSLDSWLEYSDRSASQADALAKDISRLELRIADKQARLRTLVDSDFSSFADNWEKENQEACLDLKKNEHELVEEALRYGRTAESVKETISRLELELGQHLDKEFRAQGSFDKIQEKVNNARDAATASRTRCTDAEERAARAGTNKTCPTCGQSVRALFTDPTVDMKEFARSLRMEYVMVRDKYTESQRLLSQSQETLLGFSQQVSNTRELLRNKRNEYQSATRGFESLDNKIEDAQRRVDELKRKQNPFKEKQQEVEADIKRTSTDITNYVHDMDALVTAQAGFSWWVKGFKDVRLKQIQQALTQLEIEVNSSLVQLGLIGWSLKFDISRETKTSKISKGFFVTVTSPSNKNPVPWEAWSGGEAQRLRLATTLGLGNLIRSTYGIQLDLEVWDEPTTYMSSAGVEDLLAALAARAQDEKRQVWIVDHRTLGSSAFSGIVLISKSSRTSSIEQLVLTTEGE